MLCPNRIECVRKLDSSLMAALWRAGGNGVSEVLRGGVAAVSVAAAAAATWLRDRLPAAQQSLSDIPESVGQVTVIAGALRAPAACHKSIQVAVASCPAEQDITSPVCTLVRLPSLKQTDSALSAAGTLGGMYLLAQTLTQDDSHEVVDPASQQQQADLQSTQVRSCTRFEYL